jgi:hypothetical protein
METKTWTQFKKELLKDKEIAKEYEKLGPEFELIKKAIQKRLEKEVVRGKSAELASIRSINL